MASRSAEREDARDGDAEDGALARADALGISREAVELYQRSDVIDLHVDTFIWSRVFGYDMTARHGHGVFGARFYGQSDIPRLLEAGVTGAIWSITTNPLRTAQGRAAAFERNVARLLSIFDSVGDRVSLVRSAAEYRAARAEGKHGAFVGVQGGNALDHDPSAWARVQDGAVTRVTLVHLSSSTLGSTSSPLAFVDRGLTAKGREVVELLDENRILVDLAHVSKKGFYDAVDVHDRTKPLIVTHTGVSGVYPHWRNLDDAQLRAIADSGGTIGVMYHGAFLERSTWRGRASAIADHVEHIVKVVGEDHASLGSDWDGAITTPRDMPTVLELPRLVQLFLDRGFSAERIQKILAGNFLRTMAALRG
ncbi:MAG TPA: membrane dipeptidase [Polyangiaceae bacterium]|nr:membrane dipeptidase [Polyangiaceae bacterium]